MSSPRKKATEQESVTIHHLFITSLLACCVLLLCSCFYQLPEMNNTYDPLAANTANDTTSTYKIPTKTITVDGNPDDWEGINPLIVDPVGDNIIDESSSDITKMCFTVRTVRHFMITFTVLRL